MPKTDGLPAPYYSRDGITIYHGDCSDILPLLEPVDLVLTDPPFHLPAQIHSLRSKWPRSLSDMALMFGFYRDALRQIVRLLKVTGARLRLR
jgi:DNA modification methylase